jgi:hypothetical protein
VIGLTPEAVELLREERVLATVSKNSREQIRITYRNVDGRELVTVAVWAKVGDDYLPTKAGFGLSPVTLASLLDGVRTATRAIEGRA